MKNIILIIILNAAVFAGMYSPVMTEKDQFRELLLGLVIWGAPVWGAIAIWLCIVIPIQFIIYLCKNTGRKAKPVEDFKSHVLDNLEK